MASRHMLSTMKMSVMVNPDAKAHCPRCGWITTYGPKHHLTMLAIVLGFFLVMLVVSVVFFGLLWLFIRG